ncbi:MAG TPA: hypothetical protein VNV86_02605, partial [Candidatus Acidoferrum sp.]|nr:hypothetical protein [Candidatus Acidoferrum sp.]
GRTRGAFSDSLDALVVVNLRDAAGPESAAAERIVTAYVFMTRFVRSTASSISAVLVGDGS